MDSIKTKTLQGEPQKRIIRSQGTLHIILLDQAQLTIIRLDGQSLSAMTHALSLDNATPSMLVAVYHTTAAIFVVSRDYIYAGYILTAGNRSSKDIEFKMTADKLKPAEMFDGKLSQDSIIVDSSAVFINKLYVDFLVYSPKDDAYSLVIYTKFLIESNIHSIQKIALDYYEYDFSATIRICSSDSAVLFISNTLSSIFNRNNKKQKAN
jgi:hypothetical protein